MTHRRGDAGGREEWGGGGYRAGETLTETETHRETETYKEKQKSKVG